MPHVWIDDIKLEIYKSFVKQGRFDAANNYVRDTSNVKEITGILRRFNQTFTTTWTNAKYYANLKDNDYVRQKRNNDIAKSKMDSVIHQLKSPGVDPKLIVEAYTDMGLILIHLKRPQDASRYIDSAKNLAQKLNLNINLSLAYRLLSNQESETQEYKDALVYQKISSVYKDSIAALKNEKQFDSFRLLLEKNNLESIKARDKLIKQGEEKTMTLEIPIVIIFLLGLSAWFKIWSFKEAVIKFLVVVSFLLGFEGSVN